MNYQTNLNRIHNDIIKTCFQFYNLRVMSSLDHWSLLHNKYRNQTYIQIIFDQLIKIGM